MSTIFDISFKWLTSNKNKAEVAVYVLSNGMHLNKNCRRTTKFIE